MEEDEEEEEQLHCSELAGQRIVVSGFGPFQLPRAGLVVEASPPIASILLVWRGPAFSRWRCLVEQGSAVRQSWTMSSAELDNGRSRKGLSKPARLLLGNAAGAYAGGLTGSLREPYAENAQTFPVVFFVFSLCSSKGQYCVIRPNG